MAHFNNNITVSIKIDDLKMITILYVEKMLHFPIFEN